MNASSRITLLRTLASRRKGRGSHPTSSSRPAIQSSTQVGEVGLLFPKKLNKATVPRLWEAKQRIIREIENQNFEFVIVAHAGAEAGLGAGQMAAGLVGRLAPVGRAPVGGRQARWTPTGTGKAGGTTRTPATPPARGAQTGATATRGEMLKSAYEAFRGRASGLTGPERGALARIREFFRLPPAPTKSKNLPQMLPKGAELIVVTPDSTYIVRSSQL